MRAARAGAALALAALLCAAAAPLPAAPAKGAPVPRTIVVRGLVRGEDGRPLVRARVSVRGSATVNAVTNDRGRYSLSLPLGMPAALARAPFRLDVRAEGGGRRVPLAGGGEALVLEATWDAAANRARVTANREDAATAVRTALEVDEVPVAWIEADFGDTAAAEPAPAVPAAARATPGPATSPGRAAAVQPQADSTRAKVAGRVPGAANATPPAAGPKAPPKPRARPMAPARDTTATPATAPVANAAASPAAKAPAGTAAPRPDPGGAAATARDTARVVATSRAVASPPARPSAVRAIDPFEPRVDPPAPDTCGCSLRGTVEIQWDRPLEFNTPMRVELDAPGTPPAELSLFMGAPREFRFGPLPCGDWRLTLVGGGRFHYADAHGDTTRVVRCEGPSQTRIVLVPTRR